MDTFRLSTFLPFYHYLPFWHALFAHHWIIWGKSLLKRYCQGEVFLSMVHIISERVTLTCFNHLPRLMLNILYVEVDGIKFFGPDAFI